jgi:plastocyanin/mono/diheme cytochrome c family protein
MVTVIKALVAVLVLAIAAALIVIYSGIYNIAADDSHFDMVRWTLATAKRNSVAQYAENIVAPQDLAAEARVQAGAQMYRETCVQCHLAPGMSPTPLHEGLKPTPPKFAEGLPDFAPRELFWIVKHGYKMTGMPAWGKTHTDEEIWDAVAFLARLPNLSSSEYADLLSAASSSESEQQKQKGKQAGQSGGGATKGQAGQKEQAEQKEKSSQPAASVNMTDELTFKPRTVEIKRGETILWKNPSSLMHTVTADPSKANDKSHVQLPKGAEPFHSGDIQPDGEYRHTFNVPGRYRYFCVPHEAAGMAGEVIVK